MQAAIESNCFKPIAALHGHGTAQPLNSEQLLGVVCARS